jgi:hypothetical protein
MYYLRIKAMKINMTAAKVFVLLKASVMPILVCMFGLSNSANALETDLPLPYALTGAQVCQPASLAQAQIGGGISWQSTGIRNNTGQTLWVICELTTMPEKDTRTDVGILAFNTTPAPANVQCIIKVINPFTITAISSTTVDIALLANLPNYGTSSIEKTAEIQSASVSCKLPTGTGVSAIATGSELIIVP